MKLSTRLLLGHVLVLALVGGALAVVLPRVVARSMLQASAQLLAQQAENAAQQLALRSLGGRVVLQSSAYTLGAAYAVMDPTGRVVAAGPLPFLVELVGLPAPRELEQLARSAVVRGTAHAIFVYQDITLVAGAAPIRPRGQTASVGVILFFQEAQDLDPAIRELTWNLFRWTLVGLIAAVVLAGLLGRGIVARLAELRAAAAGLAEGDLSRRVPETGRDELADLARSFNHMAARLERLVAGLRQSEELRRQMMATIAHELRTPVTSIRGFAEALQDGLVPPERQPHYFSIIAGEAARLSRLIQDLFDLAKLEAGQLEFRMQPLPAREWLERFARATRPRVEAAGLRLEVRLPPAEADLWITGDQDRLDQVLYNLVENGIRYSPPGGTIRLELVPRPEAGAVEVAVADAGPGIPPEEQDRIWERFYQGRDRQGRGGGAGLGLAIVRSIVEAHGGRVGVESTPGRGARFWFTLPLASRSG
ncbi:MAG: HAMP domain-containing sensor histidine kinase [Bacillota bacterium]